MLTINIDRENCEKLLFLANFGGCLALIFLNFQHLLLITKEVLVITKIKDLVNKKRNLLAKYNFLTTTIEEINYLDKCEKRRCV